MNRRWPLVDEAVLLLLTFCAGAARGDDMHCEASSEPATRQRAEQKTLLLQRYTEDPARAETVRESEIAAATEALSAARELATRAGTALDEGCHADAERMASEGLVLASRSFSLIRQTNETTETAYRDLLARTETFLQAIEAIPEDVSLIGRSDFVGMRRQISTAQTQAVGGDFDAASRTLKPVVDRLERRLVAVFDQRTIYYEKTFESAEDEYAYLRQKYEGYRILLAQIEQSGLPAHSARDRYRELLAKAAEYSDTSGQRAGQGDWRLALDNIRLANEACEQALRLTGLSF